MPFIGKSLNAIYAGIHWSVRKKHADEAHSAVAIAVMGIKPFTTPVHLEFQPVVKGRGYDVMNYSYSAKLIEDGLVCAGILEDDTVAYVKQIAILAPIKTKAQSSMCVTITGE